MESTDYESRRKTQNREAQRRYRQKQKDRVSQSQSREMDTDSGMQLNGTGEDWPGSYGVNEAGYADHMTFEDGTSLMDHAGDSVNIFPVCRANILFMFCLFLFTAAAAHSTMKLVLPRKWSGPGLHLLVHQLLRRERRTMFWPYAANFFSAQARTRARATSTSTSSRSSSRSDSSGPNSMGKSSSSSSKLPKSHAKIHAKIDRMVDELSQVYDFGVEMQLISPDEQLYGSISFMKTQFHRSIIRAAKSSYRR
ncbi:hypothetical protein HC256_003698 [Beauveria bassiana]|nr:hypothetical protein HC256_003698 [Beauveria bassiana]